MYVIQTSTTCFCVPIIIIFICITSGTDKQSTIVLSFEDALFNVSIKENAPKKFSVITSGRNGLQPSS